MTEKLGIAIFMFDLLYQYVKKQLVYHFTKDLYDSINI